MNEPTHDALKLARAIVDELCGRTGFDVQWWDRINSDTKKEVIVHMAATIDTELLLPEKHAALLLAQGVVECWERGDLAEAVWHLDEALTKITHSGKAPAGEAKKTTAPQPPEAGQEQAGSPS